jgi:DNA replication ATP-dependent helicase Dna2
MIINNTKHISLIQDELIYQTNEFEKLLKKQAAKMFVDKQLYLCRHQGYDEVRGNIILKFDHKICFAPRKNETLQCFVSKIQEDNVKNWGGLTYENLRTNIATQFECKTVFFTYEKDHTIVGLSGVKVEDVGKYERNALVFLAPTDPPLQYIINLVDFLKQVKPDTSELLKLDIENPTWKPQPLIVDEEFVSKLQTDFFENDTIIIQGPPGTGKTYLMALLCGALLKSDFRILVTALTNRALIELAEKEHLKSSLQQGKVFKSALTADESKNKNTKGLQSFKSLSKQRPPLLLTTYYIMSQIATKAVVYEHFDYIIIEEASQAFLSTIALAKKLGKKCIIIGDIKQLEPIFHKEYAPEDTNNYHWMICGLKAISFYLPNAKQYILTESYRLTENSIKGTNLFYGDVLKSKSDVKLPLDFANFLILKKYLNNYGGSSMIRFKLPAGRLPSNDCSIFIVKLIDEIKRFNTKAEIAVLAFHKDSIRLLQTKIFTKCVNTENVLVETIDRIQGLTTDFCIFFVPTESVPFALQANRFNVATSRAKLCTLIISDETISSFYSLIDDNVKQYMLSLDDLPYNEEKTEYNKPKIEPENRTGLKVLGKIDLSKFERPKKEIKKNKENLYIIDTNVFVDYPDIISRINKKYPVILSAKVIDELDNLKSKLDNESKRNVQKALKSINSHLDTRDLRMEISDLSLLPVDFSKRSPDNQILTVALKFKKENPILLTSDNGLQIKAKGLKLTTITLKEFLDQLKRK